MKMTIHGHFHIIPLKNSMGKKIIGSHNMTMFYPNLCSKQGVL